MAVERGNGWAGRAEGRSRGEGSGEGTRTEGSGSGRFLDDVAGWVWASASRDAAHARRAGQEVALRAAELVPEVAVVEQVAARRRTVGAMRRAHTHTHQERIHTHIKSAETHTRAQTHIKRGDVNGSDGRSRAAHTRLQKRAKERRTTGAASGAAVPLALAGRHAKGCGSERRGGRGALARVDVDRVRPRGAILRRVG